MRELSIRQATNCEQAREPVCKCRCGGRLHGAKRGDGAAFFHGLPEDDPHHLLTATEKREQRNERERKKREEAAKQRWEAYQRRWAARQDEPETTYEPF